MKLRKAAIIKMQGVALIILGLVCHKMQSDGAALFMWLLGVTMLLANAKIINKIIYRAALKIVRSERRKML